MTKQDSSVASSHGNKQPIHRRCLEGFSRAVNGTLERMFDKLGRFIARRPALVIVIAILFSALLGSGLTQIDEESRGEKLWVPDDNESQDNNDFVEEYFPAQGILESFHLKRKDGGNILTPAAFDRFLALHNKLLQLVWENNGDIPHLPDQVKFTTLCLNENAEKGAQDFRECVISNPVELFSYNPQLWATETQILNTINNPSSWNSTLAGRGTTIGSVVGGAQPSTDQIQTAAVLGGSYLVARNQTLYDKQEDDKSVREWEQVFLDAFEEENENDNEFIVTRFTGRSFDDEFGDTINGDIALLQIAIILLFLYTCIALSNCKDGFVGRRIGLVIAGFVNIALAILSSYGFCSYIGLFFTDLMSILPFIMMGVGVDGMFVISTALDVTSEELPMEERMAQAMKHGGVSVTVASLTNFGAFMIGSNTSLPALAAFSVYAAFGLLFNLILQSRGVGWTRSGMQVTFFAACLCIDKKREINRRWDICCCVKSERQRGAGCCGGYIFPGFPKERLSNAVMTWLGKQYSRKPVRIAVVVAWLALLAVGISGTAQIEVGADVNNFVPSGSYLEDWINTVEDYFTSTGTEVNLYWQSTEERTGMAGNMVPGRRWRR